MHYVTSTAVYKRFYYFYLLVLKYYHRHTIITISQTVAELYAGVIRPCQQRSHIAIRYKQIKNVIHFTSCLFYFIAAQNDSNTSHGHEHSNKLGGIH